MEGRICKEKLLRLAIVSITGYLAAFPSSYAQQANSLVSFSLEKTTLTQHEPVIVDFHLLNLRFQRFEVDLGEERKNITVKVVDPVGVERERPPLRPKNGPTTLGNVSLKKGEDYYWYIVLNEWFLFDRPGRYKIDLHLSAPITVDGRAEYFPSVSLFVDILPPDEDHLKRVCGQLLQRIVTPKSAADSLAATMALSYVNNPVAVPFLEKALQQSGNPSRIISALARFKSRDAVMVLIRALGLPNSEMRDLVRSTLRAVSHEVDPITKAMIEQALQK